MLRPTRDYSSVESCPVSATHAPPMRRFAPDRAAGNSRVDTTGPYSVPGGDDHSSGEGPVTAALSGPWGVEARRG